MAYTHDTKGAGSVGQRRPYWGEATGGHMDLQAVRYAAMVSTMSFEDVVATYHAFLAVRQPGGDVDARGRLVAFLGAEEDAGEEPTIASQVRIILVSADFGREITTTVLWLNGFEGMDIRCVRLVPYQLDDRVVLDVQQVIPLPEATDYQVRVRRKEAERSGPAPARPTAGTSRSTTSWWMARSCRPPSSGRRYGSWWSSWPPKGSRYARSTTGCPSEVLTHLAEAFPEAGVTFRAAGD